MPGSRSSSSAARSKRDIIASNGFSSLRKRSLSGRTILSVGKRRSVAMCLSMRPVGAGGAGAGWVKHEVVEEAPKHLLPGLGNDALRNIPQRDAVVRPARDELDRVLERTDHHVRPLRL